jgi:MYXO-CTERM domain-containing protein
VRTHAAAWNATREDPDIADDITLLDKFSTNLTAVGAYPGLDASNCYGGGGWEGGDDLPYDEGYGDDTYRGCSTGGAPGWLALVGLALVTVRRRRRR